MAPRIQAYAVQTSFVAGNPIEVALASRDAALDPTKHYWLKLVNLGDGTTKGPLTPLTAADVAIIPSLPSHAEENGYHWPTKKSVPTAADWPSCLYYSEVLEEATPIPGSRAFFVLCSPTPGIPNQIVIHCPFATVHAYGGTWGNRGCLYDSTHQWRGRRVTTQRPIDSTTSEGYHGFTDDSPTVQLWQWLQSKDGYHADICSSWDLHNNPGLLNAYRILVLAGHDEYWSKDMRDHVEAFVARGGHMANFSGNTAWWQIRYSVDGSSITCYKNVLEDPLLGIDDSRVTCNWSTDPPDRPENTLTGFAFRFGFPTGGPVTIAPDTPTEALPLWSGVLHPDKLGKMGGEVDGVEVDFSDPSHPVPTYRDGTPDTFKLLAYDLPVVPGDRERHIAIGYFTNVGTVIGCPAINWFDDFADADVATFTFNIFTWLLGRGAGPPMGPSRFVRAPRDWIVVDVGAFTALTSSFRGHVYAASRGQIFRRHPDLATGWEPMAVTPPINKIISSLGTDLYTERLLVGTDNQFQVFTTDGRYPVATGSATAITTSMSLRAVACNDQSGGAYYVLIGPDQDHLELHVWVLGSWYSIGDASSLRTLAACDGYLLATTIDNRLVARMGGVLAASGPAPDAVACDTTWVDIGSAPHIFALGHSFGRLYGLSGTHQSSKLMWRSLRPDDDRLPVDHGRLLFYNDVSGYCKFGTFRANGDYEEQGGFAPGPGWNHVLRINNGLVLFYASDRGDALVGYVNRESTWVELRRYTGEFAAWDIVVSDGDFVLFYEAGAGTIGRFDPETGSFVSTEDRNDYSPGWTMAAATWGIPSPRLPGKGKHIIFYAPPGNIAIGEISGEGKFRTLGSATMTASADRLVAAGQLGVFAYDSKTGAGEFGEVSVSDYPTYRSVRQWSASDFATGWTLGAARNGLVFFYAPDTGVSVAGGFCRAAIFQSLNQWGADAGGFVSGWSHIVGI